MGTGEGGKGRKGGKGNGGNRGKEGRGGPGGDPRVYLKIFLRITYEIHRWHYTKFAKIWALSLSLAMAALPLTCS